MVNEKVNMDRQSGYKRGIEFEMPFHPAVIDMLEAKLGA